MRLRNPIGVLAVLLAASLLPPVANSQTRAIASGEDFPLEDHHVWLFVERGLKNQAADLQLGKATESPEALALLLDAYRPGDALMVLRRIVERRPDRMGAAFKAVSAKGHYIDDEGRGYPSVLREIVARARLRFRELPREQAAEAAWHMLFLPLHVPGKKAAPWPDQLRAFLAEYGGTEAAKLAELALLDQEGEIHARSAAFEAFARAHPGTVIGAQALYTAAMRFKATEPRGSDPTERLLRVAAFARELQSGAYPDCEWVRRAPDLVIGFFAFEPQYAKENVPRVVGVFREFLLKNFDVAVNPLGQGVGYLITNRLPALLTAGGGEPTAEIDRFLLDLEAAAAQPAAVRYVRGLWYRQVADAVREPEEQNVWRRKSDATLLDLARTGVGLYNRKALASLASIEFEGRNCGVALERYREYLSRFPTSEWAWVAGLRIGQCEQSLGNWIEARQAYESVASARPAPAPALVLGHTFAGRASEALEDFERARTAYERAERAWQQRVADPYYGTYQFYTRLDEEPCTSACDPRSKADVSKEWLRRRSMQLKRSFSLPGGMLLERGRFRVTEGAWRNAVAPLDEFIRLYPDSPNAAEAQELLTRAKLEMALLQAGPEATEEGRRAALAALESLGQEPYGFSAFAAQITRATLHSIVGSTSRATELMSDALTQWHAHGVVLFAPRSTTALQRDVIDIRDAVFDPNANWQRHEFRHLRSSDGPLPFFVATPEVRVKLYDGADARVEAASRLAARPGALLLNEEQIAILEHILMGLGGTKRHVPRSEMETPNEPIGGVEHILKFWNRFFTIGPGHWGGWIVQTFPIVTEVTFIDAARTKGAARIRTGYQGATQLLTKTDGTWKVTGSSRHWIE